MKKLLPILTIFITYQSCTQPKISTPNNNLEKYTITTYQDKLDQSTSKFKTDNVIDTIQANNDTSAYLTALKKFYNQKILERKNFNYGQPKSFIIIDKNGVDLSVKLPDKIVNGLKNQVENTPDVRDMIEDYKKDSL